MHDQDKPAALVRAVAGIGAATTARHHIAVREFFDDGTEHLGRFTVNPTLAGLERLSQRLAAVQAPLTAVVQPISMTWLALALAVERAGGQVETIGARHSARLRGTIVGKNKSDVIDLCGHPHWLTNWANFPIDTEGARPLFQVSAAG